ncbi:hypothetical protein, partial [Thiolapillus sp.]|uniref:hypothetical protein n=3 Tax=Thiolapillus sp. TaxID=2017437 RepID=UPI003AF43439
MTRTAGAPIGCQRLSRFWGLGCPKIYHEAEDTLEDPPATSATPAGEPADPAEARWIATRGTLIVLPVVLMALSNPTLYIAAILKSVSLAQQTSHIDTAQAGRELLGSTFVAGYLAALFWLGLSILPNLWMYFLWTLLFCIYIGSKAYGGLPSRYGPSFWMNVMTTLFILLGPAVEDIASGQACLRPRDRFWDIPVPKIDSAFDNLFVPQPSWSPSTTQQL